jgi:YD repeat-containing protein
MGRPSRTVLRKVPISTARRFQWRVFLSLLLLFPCSQPHRAWASDQYEYDGAGRLYRVTHHTGRITTYTFDDNDNVLSVTTSSSTTAVDGAGAPPLTFSLGRAYPNPGQSPRFTFTLPHTARVTVRVFDVSGRLVTKAVEGDFGPGLHRVELRTGEWAAGVYYYRLETPGFSRVEKFVHLK